MHQSSYSTTTAPPPIPQRLEILWGNSEAKLAHRGCSIPLGLYIKFIPLYLPWVGTLHQVYTPISALGGDFYRDLHTWWYLVETLSVSPGGDFLLIHFHGCTTGGGGAFPSMPWKPKCKFPILPWGGGGGGENYKTIILSQKHFGLFFS